MPLASGSLFFRPAAGALYLFELARPLNVGLSGREAKVSLAGLMRLVCLVCLVCRGRSRRRGELAKQRAGAGARTRKRPPIGRHACLWGAPERPPDCRLFAPVGQVQTSQSEGPLLSASSYLSGFIAFNWNAGEREQTKHLNTSQPARSGGIPPPPLLTWPLFCGFLLLAWLALAQLARASWSSHCSRLLLFCRFPTDGLQRPDRSLSLR